MSVTSQLDRLRDLLRGEILEVRGEDDSTGGLVRVAFLLRIRGDSTIITRRVAIDCLGATSGPFIDVANISEEEWNQLR
jgi:hypothetical protein